MAGSVKNIAANIKVLALITALITAAITPFMLVVWKQVYISGSALKQSDLTDSIAVLKAKIAERGLVAGQLAATARIEQIARSHLSLDYPAAAQIVVVRIVPRKDKEIGDMPIFSAIWRTFTQSRG